jgi:predicted component of type VI protein secretion system
MKEKQKENENENENEEKQSANVRFRAHSSLCFVPLTIPNLNSMLEDLRVLVRILDVYGGLLIESKS